MAGEPSGDAIGARLMSALKRETNGAVRFAGIGGERMIAEGLQSDFPMTELSIIGLAEVLPRAPRILRRVRETAARVRDLEPDAVVSIDATGFCFRVEKRLKAAHAGVPLIHYVAPMVWAWRPWKAKLIAGFLDHLMVLLPFEPPYFEREGLATTFVGHPVIEERVDKADGPAFRARHGIPADAPLLAILPGSRHGEVKRLMPIFAETLGLLARRFPGLRAVVATVETVAHEVEAAASGWAVPTTVVRGPDEKLAAFVAANAALAASGTVSLELALARCPMVIGYRVSPLTVALLRIYFGRHRQVNHASIVNILLDRALIPEFLQDDCRADRLADAVARLLSDPAARAAQIEGAAPALAALGTGGEAPSRVAARTVLGVIAHKTNPAAGA
jgi:lipid-A-disaccharide synthase